MKKSELKYLNSVLDTYEEALRQEPSEMEPQMKFEALSELSEIVEVLEQEYKLRTSEKIVQLACS